jgi:hypothetical protein
MKLDVTVHRAKVYLIGEVAEGEAGSAGVDK